MADQLQQRSNTGSGPMRRLITGALFLAPCLSLTVLFLYSMSIKAVAVDTGDPLADRFISELAQTTVFVSPINPAAYSYGMYDYRMHGLSEARLVGWESEFAEDPRYWDLLYNFALVDDWARGTGLRPANELREWYLEESHLRGKASGPMLLNLIRDKESEWWDDAYNSLNIQSKPKGQSFTPYLKQIWQVIDESYKTEYDELLRDLEIAAPTEAQALYHRGLSEACRGNYDSALQYMERGNNAPVNSNMLGFPFESSDVYLCDRVTEDMILTGVVSVELQSQGLPNYLNIKRQTQLLIDEAVARGDLNGLDELHVFCCRFGSFTGQGIIQALVGLVLVKKVKDGFIQLKGVNTTPEERHELARIDQLYDELRQECKNVNRTHSLPGVPKGGFDTACYYIELILSLGQSLKWRLLQDFAGESTYTDDCMTRELIPRFEELARFRYSTLSWENEPKAEPTE